jgi:hypothetical protein
MKKSFLYILIISVLFFGCNSKENEQKVFELETTNLLLIDENLTLKNQISDLENKIFELEKSLESINSELSKYLVNDVYYDQLYETHDLQYTLDFKDGGFNTKVYKTPNLKEEIYVIQKNDIAEVSHIVHVKETNKTTIKVRVNNKIDGFIKINRNPYHNGKFSFVEKIDVMGDEITTLKLESKFVISEGTIIKELPSNNSKKLHEISHKEGGEYFKSIAITSDYQWVKMVVGEITGWVPASTLSIDMGGPTIYTPEESIYWDLIGGNLI